MFVVTSENFSLRSEIIKNEDTLSMTESCMSRQQVVSQILLNTRCLETKKLHNTEKISVKELDVALDDLVGLRPGFKMLFEACDTVVMADNLVLAQKIELLRVVVSSLDCSMPKIWH